MEPWGLLPYCVKYDITLHTVSKQTPSLFVNALGLVGTYLYDFVARGALYVEAWLRYFFLLKLNQQYKAKEEKAR